MMFNKRLNYEKIYYDRTVENSYISDYTRQQIFLSSVYKMCPSCGSVVNILSKGCDNCLYQFKGRTKWRTIKK